MKLIPSLVNSEYSSDYRRADRVFSVDTVPARERAVMETSLVIEKDTPAVNTTQPMVKRTASFVSLTLKDVPSAYHDPSVSTISGTLVSQTPVFKTLTQRRLQRMYRRHHQQQQQQQQTFYPHPHPHPHPKLSSRIESEQISSTPPPAVAMPNLMELAMRASPLPNIAGSIDSGKRLLAGPKKKFCNLLCFVCAF